MTTFRVVVLVVGEVETAGAGAAGVLVAGALFELVAWLVVIVVAGFDLTEAV